MWGHKCSLRSQQRIHRRYWCLSICSSRSSSARITIIISSSSSQTMPSCTQPSRVFSRSTKAFSCPIHISFQTMWTVLTIWRPSSSTTPNSALTIWIRYLPGFTWSHRSRSATTRSLWWSKNTWTYSERTTVTSLFSVSLCFFGFFRPVFISVCIHLICSSMMRLNYCTMYQF